MTITLGNYTGEPNALDKTYTVTNTFDGTLRDKTSIMDPVVLFQTEPVTSVNYMYIPAFGRYYFINDIQVKNNQLWEVYGHVDVLKSFATEIRNWYAIVERAENQYNLYLNDPEFQVEQRPQIQLLKFPAGFERSYAQRILILAGNGGNE